jgi:hypothetical protein
VLAAVRRHSWTATWFDDGRCEILIREKRAPG